MPQLSDVCYSVTRRTVAQSNSSVLSPVSIHGDVSSEPVSSLSLYADSLTLTMTFEHFIKTFFLAF